MKLKSFITIFSLLLVMLGCSGSDTPKEEETVTEVKYIYFLDEEVVVTREEGKEFITTVRYEGKPFEGAIRVPYTITFPNADGAVEGEDFILPNDSGIFEVVEGSSSTMVTLIETLLPNVEVTNRRALTFNLQAATGSEIGSPADGSGTRLKVVLEPTDP